MELYNFCLEVCSPHSFMEMQQNMQRSDELVEEAELLSPPPEYEQSYAAFMSAVETADHLVYRIAFQSIGGAEGNSLAQDAISDMARAYDLAPERGQRFYDEYPVTGPSSEF